MKFTFDKDLMLKEISIAQEIISTKNALSILSNVLLIAESGSLTIKATDVKMNFETRIPVDIQEEGSTTIFCDKFMNILNSLPSGDIEFEKDDIKVVIKPTTKKVKFQLKSMASDKFPDFKSAENVPYFDFKSETFRNMITQTLFAVSDDETRYFMNGVFIEKKEDKINMVATDGRRLSFISEKENSSIEQFPSVIIPTKILNVILKRSPLEGNIQIAIVDKMIFFQFGNYKFSSVLIEGQFPNYVRVIPEKQQYYFEVQKSDLLEALKRTNLLADLKTKRIYFKLNPGVLSILTESDIGDANEDLPCQYDGEEVVIGLNSQYIEEPIKVIGTDRIRFEFTESMKAITIKPEPEVNYFHIVMPMQNGQ